MSLPIRHSISRVFTVITHGAELLMKRRQSADVFFFFPNVFAVSLAAFSKVSPRTSSPEKRTLFIPVFFSICVYTSLLCLRVYACVSSTCFCPNYKNYSITICHTLKQNPRVQRNCKISIVGTKEKTSKAVYTHYITTLIRITRALEFIAR